MRKPESDREGTYPEVFRSKVEDLQTSFKSGTPNPRTDAPMDRGARGLPAPPWATGSGFYKQ